MLLYYIMNPVYNCIHQVEGWIEPISPYNMQAAQPAGQIVYAVPLADIPVEAGATSRTTNKIEIGYISPNVDVMRKDENNPEIPKVAVVILNFNKYDPARPVRPPGDLFSPNLGSPNSPTQQLSRHGLLAPNSNLAGVSAVSTFLVQITSGSFSTGMGVSLPITLEYPILPSNATTSPIGNNLMMYVYDTNSLGKPSTFVPNSRLYYNITIGYRNVL